jgi:hypothetical protein
MSSNAVRLLVAGAWLVSAGLYSSPAVAQPVSPAGCAPKTVTAADNPSGGAYPYSAAYPDIGCLTGKVRIVGTPARADVYIDGFFAGFVDDFNGELQSLPATPGVHAITLYRDGYRTITKRVSVTSDNIVTLRLNLERLGPHQTSAPPPLPGSRFTSIGSPRE